MSTFDTSALPPVDQASLPPSVRNGTPAAKNAYQAGLAFEQILVDQLSKELAATSSSSDGSDSGDGTSDTSGLMGSDPASSMYSQMLPTALTSSIMGSGGTGIALQLASALDPALTANAATTQAPAATGTAASPTGASAPTVSASGGAAVSGSSSTAPSAPAASVPTASTVAPAATGHETEGAEGPESGESGEDGA